MVVVAHTDDDLLFLSPEILGAVTAGLPLLVVYTTAGEAGEGPVYWQSLEDGIRSTYALMAGATNAWTDLPTGVSGRSFVRQGLDGTAIQAVYLRLPDGMSDGTGTSAYAEDSIHKLWDGRIDFTGLVDDSDVYSRDDLIALLAALIGDFQPTRILTETWPGDYTDTGDHSDHWATANFARAAWQASGSTAPLAGYYAYIIGDWAENVAGADLQEKTDAFAHFGTFDQFISSPGVPFDPDTYGLWLKRQYISATEGGPPP